MIQSKPEVKFAIIREMTARDNNLLNIECLCEIAGVSRSGYYRWLEAEPVRQARDERDKADYALVLKAYKHRGYDKGARGINMRLLREETPVVMNVKKIRRLMKKYDLRCPIRQANPYRRMMKALKTNKVAKNIVDRKFGIYGPRAVLLTDITYIPCGDGKFIYLSVITEPHPEKLNLTPKNGQVKRGYSIASKNGHTKHFATTSVICVGLVS